MSRVDVTITTPYSATATGQVGQAGSVALLANAGDFNWQDTTGQTQTKFMDVAWGSALAALVTISNSPGAGAARVTIYYSNTVNS